MCLTFQDVVRGGEIALGGREALARVGVVVAYYLLLFYAITNTVRIAISTSSFNNDSMVRVVPSLSGCGGCYSRKHTVTGVSAPLQRTYRN